MLKFAEWLEESERDSKERLESAVREYMSRTPPPKQCYYIPSPNTMNFDPNNPKHLEDELGPDYDKKIDVVPFKHHPTAFRCADVAENLVSFLRKRGFKARKVAGWYGNAEKGYRTGMSPRLDAASPPENWRTRGSKQEHWWVEAEGQYIDLTSAQFHPMSPGNQKDVVIRDKATAFDDGEYAAVRRFPIGRAVPLPEEAVRMIERILSLKKFQKGHSSNYSDRQTLRDWILDNSKKYGMEEWRAKDIALSIGEMGKAGFHFADRLALERLFAEGYDDIEEDESLRDRKNEFVPEPTASRGTVRFRRNFVSLSSTSEEGLNDNLEKLKSVILSRFPDAKFGETKNRSMPSRGGEVHYAETEMHGVISPISSDGLIKDLKKERFRLGD